MEGRKISNMVERILVGIDSSENSLEALREAVTLAELIHSEIIVVNVQPFFNQLLLTKTGLFINEEIIKEYQKELFDKATRSAIEYIQTA